MSDVKFTDNSKKTIEEKNKAVYKALVAIGMTAEGYAKAECPVDTGRLRNSISNKVVEDVAYIGTNVEYAEKVEFADYMKHTTGNAHFLRNSVTNHTDEYKKIAKKQLES